MGAAARGDVIRDRRPAGGGERPPHIGRRNIEPQIPLPDMDGIAAGTAHKVAGRAGEVVERCAAHLPERGDDGVREDEIGREVVGNLDRVGTGAKGHQPPTPRGP